MNTILAVDKGATIYELDAASCRLHGIETLRVDSMTKAIKLIAPGDDFLFIVINEDTVPGFMLKLRKMRSITNAPIFVITSSYTVEKEMQANNYGADVYSHFAAYAKINIVGALASFTAQNRLAK